MNCKYKIQFEENLKIKLHFSYNEFVFQSYFHGTIQIFEIRYQSKNNYPYK